METRVSLNERIQQADIMALISFIQTCDGVLKIKLDREVSKKKKRLCQDPVHEISQSLIM